jgi:hypothetical protein
VRFALLLLPSILLGCGEPPSQDAEVPSADTDAVAVAPPARPFDPGTIQLGDTVLGLTVTAADVSRALDDSVWVGAVVFEGDLVLHGIYQQHPDWPQVELPCVHVVQAPSIGRIPRFPADPYDGPARKTWFCFDNPDVAMELLGAPAPPREIVIAVDRYRAQHDLSDGFDTAALAEVIEVGPASTATLLEP